MTDAASFDQVRPAPVVWVLVLAAAFALYLITLDNGLALRGFAHQAHEFFHDGRHFFGVPCH